MSASPRRKSALRPVLFVFGAIAVVVVAGWVVLASALDPIRLQSELQDAVLRSTGRTLTVAGGVHLRFGLSPHVEVDGISLANVDGGSRPQMLTAKSLTAQLALIPLLGGDAVISALTIDTPDLLLERAADGTPNWQFTPAKHALYQGHGSTGSGSHHDIRIQQVTVTGGVLTWQKSQTTPQNFAIDHASLTAENDDAPVTLDFKGAYQGTTGQIPFSLSGTSGSLARLQGGPVSALAGPWPLTLQISTSDADLHVEGGISHPDQARGYQFRFTGHAANLAVFNALFAKPILPPLAGVNATGVISDGSQGEIRTSQISVHTENSDLGSVVPGLVVKQALLSAPGPGQLAQLSVDGTYAEQPLRFAASVMQPDVLASNAPLQMTLSAQAAGATLSARGTVPANADTSGLDVQVEGKAPDFSALSPLVGHALPAAQNVALNAELEDAGVKLRGIAVRNFMVGSSLGDVAGEFTVNWSPRPSITGTLASRSLNLDALLSGAPGDTLPLVWPPPQNSAAPVQPQADTTPVPPPPGKPLVLAPLGLPLPFLRTHDADLSLTVAELAAWGEHYRDVAAHLQLVDGKLTLNPFRAMAPEGALIGGASVDATTDQPPVAISLRSPSISAGALAAFFGHPGEAKGTLQVDAELSGMGQTAPAIEASLNGRLGLAMVGGQVSDSLAQAFLGDAMQVAGVPSLGDGNFQVRCFALRMDFSGGVGSIRALAADTSRVSLSGGGTVDLNGGKADLHLRPQVRLGPTEVAAPVSVAGNFGDLKATLDPVMGGGRVGIQIGGGGGGSGCGEKLALARNGLGGPIPQVAAALPDSGMTIKIKKPKDLLQGLFH